MKPSWKELMVRFKFAMMVGILALSACAQAAPMSREAVPPPQAVTVEKAVMEAPAPASGYAPDSGGVANSTVPQAVERIVLKNASLSIVVADPPKTMDTISRMADEMGGYVVSANMYKETLSSGLEAPRGSVQIRVPAGRLNEALSRIRAESAEPPISENISSQDVTNEYVDLKSRLKNLEAAEVELTEIMKDANRTEDVLSVYNQLVSIREQIEVIKGQIKYYEQSAALSSVTVELIADEAMQPISIAGWQPQGIAKDAVEAMIKTMQFLVSALIWIVLYLLPVLLVIFMVFLLPPILLIRAWRKSRRRRKEAQKANTPPAEPGN